MKLVMKMITFKTKKVSVFSLALTHDRMPDYPPLPDVILDNTPYQVHIYFCSKAPIKFCV